MWMDSIQSRHRASSLLLSTIRHAILLFSDVPQLLFIQKIEIFIGSRISKFLRPAQRYDDFKLDKFKKTSKTAVFKLKKTSKTAVVLLAGVTISGTPCSRHITVPFGAEAPSGHVAQGPGLSNPTSFLRPALPMAPTRDDNSRDKRSVLRPNLATFIWDFTLIWRQRTLLY